MRSGTSIGSPVAPIRPTLRTPSGNRRKAPSVRVQVTPGSTTDRPPLATRCRQSDRSGHSAAIGQPEQSRLFWISHTRTSATRGDSPSRVATRSKSFGNDRSRARSSNNRFGSASSGSLSVLMGRSSTRIRGMATKNRGITNVRCACARGGLQRNIRYDSDLWNLIGSWHAMWIGWTANVRETLEATRTNLERRKGTDHGTLEPDCS